MTINNKGKLKLFLEGIVFSATTYAGLWLDHVLLRPVWLLGFFLIYALLYLVLYQVLLVLVGLDGHPPANAPALVTPLLLVILVFSTIIILLPSSPVYLGWGLVFIVALIFSDEKKETVS